MQCLTGLGMCSFVHIRPEEPWTRDPISMRCSLLKSYKSKSLAGSYVSANKTCLPKNETVVTCGRNFKFDPSNPIHRMFQRKRQHAESTLRRFFETVLDLDPHRLTKSRSDRQHQSPSDQSYDDPPADSHVTSNTTSDQIANVTKASTRSCSAQPQPHRAPPEPRSLSRTL